jgi:hypothetical protein
VSFSSNSAAMHDTVEADSSKPPIFSSIRFTLRVETPMKYISAQATNSARSLRCHFANSIGEYSSTPRA